LTWRGFIPEELERKQKSKGKEVVYAIKDMEINKLVSEEEDNKFLKLMKKTLARIFLMSFILSFEPHCNALQIVLNKVYMPQDIAQKTMKHLVERIHATNYLYFTEDELDTAGMGHNKPLYITVR